MNRNWLPKNGVPKNIPNLSLKLFRAKKIPKQAFCFSCAESYFRI